MDRKMDHTPEADLAASENLEQSQETTDRRAAVPRAEYEVLRAAAQPLLAELEDLPDGDLIAQVVDNALKLLRDRINRGDLKLVNKSLKELRYALRVFAPYRDTRKVSIFGSARTAENHADYTQAAEFARQMAASGWMVITGAGGGIMAAGHGGAGADPSFGLAIRLPFEQATNPFIRDDPKLINFKYFFTRKLMFVRSSHAIALFPGGFGTMDEGFEVLTLIQTGKSAPMPVVFVDHPGGDYWRSWQCYVKEQLLARGLIGQDDQSLYKVTDSVDAAVREVRHFYANFHSVRYWRDDILIRLRRAPDAAQLRHIDRRFADIKTRGEFRVCGPLKAEVDEPALNDLPRLVFAFNKRDHGRLRQLIDFLNDMPGPDKTGHTPRRNTDRPSRAAGYR
jgi:uncharacterized protein (TIGR00730 family)